MLRRLLPLALGLVIAAMPFLPTAPLARADAQPPGVGGTMATCFLAQATFCDDFSEGPSTGSAANRGGALDPAKWSFARVTEAENPGQGQYFAFAPVTAQFCQTPLPGVLPDRDSFMCDGTNGVTTQDVGSEDMHWMTAINDDGSYVSVAARALQPFDFASRTGTISFMVDAVTEGPHAAWPALTFSADPEALTHENKPGIDAPPRDGFQIDWNSGCGTPATLSADGVSALSPYPATKIGQVALFTDYAETDLALPTQADSVDCIAAAPDHPNLIQVQVSETSLDVYAADAIANMQPGMPMAPPMLKHVLHLDQGSGFTLPVSRGYVSFQQSQYAACKFNAMCQQTYHWHAIGFDGPRLRADAVAEVPDALTPAPGGAVNVGYPVQGQRTWTVAGLPVGQPGYLSFDWRTDGATDPALAVRVNGGAAIPVQSPPGLGHYSATTGLAAIPAGELRSDGNTLELDSAAPVTVANIDLGVSGADSPPAPTATPTASPTPVLTATPTPSPSATATSTPTPEPSATATATATATAAPTDTPTPSPAPVPGLIEGQHYACTSHDGGQSYECVRP